VKNGSTSSGKRKYQCKECKRQFVQNPKSNKISEETKQLIDKLLLEKISLAGIVRSTQVSKRWLQYYVNKKYAERVKKHEENKELDIKKSLHNL
jgi:transposase-like protein